MSELIEVHQLDYKACSLTYGEGTCTAQAGTRPAGDDSGVFNGSTSQVQFDGTILEDSRVYDFEFEVVFDTVSSGMTKMLYEEYKTGSNSGWLVIEWTSNNIRVTATSSVSSDRLFLNIGNATAGETYKFKVSLNKTGGPFVNSMLGRLYIDGVQVDSDSAGSGTWPRFTTAGIATLGKGDSSSQWGLGLADAFDGKMLSFTSYVDDVKVRELLFNNNVDDETGNSTPTATDVAFSAVCPDGVDPQNPSLCALVPDPNKKCFNTYATCQDRPNYSATTKTLTFTKQNSALPKESVQSFIGRGIFNGSTSGISLSPFISNTSDVYTIELKFNFTSIVGGTVLYSEYISGNEQFRIYVDNSSNHSLYCQVLDSTGQDTETFPLGYGSNANGKNITANITIQKNATNSQHTDITVSIDGGAPVTKTAQKSLSNYNIAKVGAWYNVSFLGSIYYFKAYKNGVLIRDLQMLDATDATGNSAPVATDVTFEQVAGPLISSTVGFFPSITNSSTQSAELNVGARRFDLNTLGKSSSASITMTDAPYSDNLTDPYVLERTYNPLERGTFWGKFLAQNPYYSGDEYRIYTGEAGQNISDMDYKRYLVDKITLPNSAGTVSISCVDQLRTLDFDKAIFLDAGTFTIQGSISQSDVDILTNYPVGTTADLPDTLQPYFKLDDELIKFGNLGQQNGYYKFESCIRGQFGTTAESHENSTIQLCHYFQKSNVLPTAQAGLYYHLKTLYNDAGWADSLLDLTGWESEISTRLSLYDDVKRLVHEPTPTADLIGELQRDCGFFSWFDEYDKKLKIKAVRPEIESYSIDEYNHILAGTANFNVESQDRITQLVFSYDMPNKVLSVDNRDSYSRTHMTLTDKANPNQYGQSITHVIKSPWLQSLAQVKRTSNRIIQRYDDSTTFCNFMLDRSFNVRMGQVFKMAHSGTQNADGSPRSILWQVIGIDRVQDKIKVKAQQFYLDAGYGVWGDSSIPNYSNSTDEQREKYFYWGITKWG